MLERDVFLTINYFGFKLQKKLYLNVGVPEKNDLNYRVSISLQ